MSKPEEKTKITNTEEIKTMVAEKMTTEQAKEMLELERLQRVDNCMEGMNVLLQRNKCKLTSIVIIQDGQISTRIDIIPVD